MKTPTNALDALIATGREAQELQAKLDDANQRIASLSTEYTLLEGERATLLDALDSAQATIEAQAGEIERLKDELSKSAFYLKALQKRIDDKLEDEND